MPIAFYAPMKPPDHPVPSGDRQMARSLWAALERAGYRPRLASRFVAFDAVGDDACQARLGEHGRTIAAALLQRYRALPAAARPRLWFTYHLYHKAPDWLGPVVAAGLGIPYVVAEASHAAKQANRSWARGYRAAAAAITAADLVFSPNPDDDEGVRPLLADPSRLVPIRPGIDVAPFAAAAARRAEYRRRLAAHHDLDVGQPWLLTAAMMRDGAKLASYRLLAAALARLGDQPWQAIIAGDGPAAATVRAAFAPVADRIVWLGEVAGDALPGLFAAADLYLWPAIDEAFGVALIEAQAAALPVVAGARPGVAGIIADGRTGRLTPPGDAAAFAAAVASLLADPALRRSQGEAAALQARRHHSTEATAALLRRHLQPLLARFAGEEGGRPACPAA